MHAVAAAGSGLVCHEWRATAVRRWGVPAPPARARGDQGQSAQAGRAGRPLDWAAPRSESG